MRSNTNRTRRFSFGALAHDYDLGRRRLDPGLVERVLLRLGISDSRRDTGSDGHGRSVLEVGAGTGQLTGALLDSRAVVTAVEPSDPLRARLQERRADDLRVGRLRTLAKPFEDCPRVLEHASVDEIWSADAFHWIDPAVGYQAAASLLRPGGWIVLLWSFPILAGDQLQASLNELYQRLDTDLQRDPATHPDDVEPSLRAGRDQLAEAAAFSEPVHWMDRTHRLVSVPQYVALQCSYGQVATLPVDRVAALRDGIAARLASYDRVELIHHEYVLAATSIAEPS